MSPSLSFCLIYPLCCGARRKAAAICAISQLTGSLKLWQPRAEVGGNERQEGRDGRSEDGWMEWQKGRMYEECWMTLQMRGCVVFYRSWLRCSLKVLPPSWRTVFGQRKAGFPLMVDLFLSRWSAAEHVIPHHHTTTSMSVCCSHVLFSVFWVPLVSHQMISSEVIEMTCGGVSIFNAKIAKGPISYWPKPRKSHKA